MYVVPAVTLTGVAKRAVCQPEADSPLNVTDASFLPPVVHSDPVWVPALALDL